MILAADDELMDQIGSLEADLEGQVA